MNDKFTPEQIEDLRYRADAVCEVLPDDWHIGMSRQQPSEFSVRLDFEMPAVPEVEGVTKYLADNYVCGPDIPGVAKFDSYQEAVDFIGEVYGYALQEDEVDYNKVLDCARGVVDEAWRDHASAIVEDATYDDLPCEGDGIPYWMEEISKAFDGAWVTATAAEDWTYSAHPAHFPENGGLLIANVHGFAHSEAEVELGYYYDRLNSMEAELLRQLFCTQGQYAYVQVSVSGALFLDPCEQNAEWLETAAETRAFREYYDRDAYRYNEPNADEAQEAVDEWCGKAELPAWNIDEPFEDWFALSFDEYGDQL